MSIFLGLIVHEAIPRERYTKTLLEIEQIMQVHKLDINILSNDNILKFKIQNNIFWVPKNPNYLNTIYYRISGDTNLQQSIELIWECICVFKENFPSKVELYQENLDEFNLQDWESELLRRQLNNLQNRSQQNELFKKDEIEDLFAILHLCGTQNNQKGQELCLNAMNSDIIQPFYLTNLQSKYFDDINRIASNQLTSQNNKMLANNILQKVMKVQQQFQTSQDMQDIVTKRPSQHDHDLINIIRHNSKYDQLHNASSIIFQLKETNEIDRICFYLDYILMKQSHMLKSIQHIVYLIAEKYFNGDYGLDSSQLTQYCVFHTLLASTVYQLQQLNNNTYDHNRLSRIFIIMEEGMVNWMTNLVQLNIQQIYTLFPSSLYQLYQSNSNIYQQLVKSHKNNILTIVCNKMGLSQSTTKSNSQLICENMEEIKCISRQLSEFLELIL